MKLNLLPTSAARGGGGLRGIILAVILVAAAIFVSASMLKKSSDALEQNQADAEKYRTGSQQAVDTAAQADTIVTQAKGVELNLNLANAMDAHNSVYPAFYDELRNYIPNYFRVTSMNATPIDANSCTVTMQGVIQTYQQYADLMLALLRIPGAQAVSRSGFQVQDTLVPSLDQNDQKGEAIEPGKSRLPKDPVDRLDTVIRDAHETKFNGAGGFGTTQEPIVRGAMPLWSAITVAIVVTKNLTTPNPRATLAGGG